MKVRRDPVIVFSKIPYYRFIYDFMNKWYGIPLWVVGLGILPYIFGTKGGWDPLLWRSDVASLASHHTIILDAFSITFLLMWKRLGINPVLAACSIFFVVAWHETLWWITDLAYFTFNHIPYSSWWFYGWLSTLCYFTLVVYPQYVILPKKFLLAGVAFYLAWFAAGFPVTVNFTGITIYYLSPVVNGVWEIGGWVYFLAAFYFLAKKMLLKRQGEMSLAVSKL